jgi:protein gp37
MSEHSDIEWTDATWNPVRGCTKISPGCKHCYAETFAERFRGVKGHPYEQGFDLRLVPAKLTEPFLWRSPKLVFVNSMSDLFQDGVPDEYIEAVCRVMVKANWHTFQVLTKRSERLRELLSGRLRFAAEHDHIWWGVSVEDQTYGLPRIDDLQKAPARVRFLSIEPLLEDLGAFDLSGISWAIVGGGEWAGSPSDGKRVGGLGARSMSRIPRAVFLQAVGRGQKGETRETARRPNVRRVSPPDCLANSRSCEVY